MCVASCVYVADLVLGKVKFSGLLYHLSPWVEGSYSPILDQRIKYSDSFPDEEKFYQQLACGTKQTRERTDNAKTKKMKHFSTYCEKSCWTENGIKL